MPTDKIRVLHIIARFNIGGTARYLSHLLPNLDTEKFETLLVVGEVQLGEVEDSRLFDLNFVRVEQLGRRINLYMDFRAYLAIRRVIKEFDPEIIHTHTFKAGVLGRLSNFKIPKVHTFHGHLLTDPEFSRLAKRIIVRIERRLARISSALVVTGERVARDLLNVRIGEHKQYLSIPGETLPMEMSTREECRHNLGLNNEFTVLWMGRVAPVKNPKLLVQIARKMPTITFIMAGNGPLFEKIKTEAPENLKILGFVNPAEVLIAADVFLSTALNEGIPYSLLEARQVGLPIVAVNCGAISEIVYEGENGFLVDADEDQIIDKIGNLFTNKELFGNMKSSAERLSQAVSSGQNFYLKHEALYMTILNQN